MKRILILILCVLFQFGVYAQDKKDKENKKVEDSVKSEVVALSDNSGLNALAQELAEKQKEIIALHDSINHLKDQYVAEIKIFQKKLTDSIGEMQNELDKFNGTIKADGLNIAKLNNQVDNLKSKQIAIDHLSDVVYKQCLLYPLEGRYNHRSIEEARYCLTELGIMNNLKYAETCHVYWDMLGNYETFNNELITFLENQMRSFSMKGWKINEVTCENALSRLKQLDYYQYYAKRNQKPWKSIIYIDNVIDDYCAMLQGKKTLNEKSYQGLIDKLKPKTE